MSLVNRTRNIFVNSEEYHDAKGQVNLVFPGSDFVVDANEMMRLTLDRFEMKRNFYNINKFNNTFYFSTGTAAVETISGECKIDEGDYATFGADISSGTLCHAIKMAITTGVGTAPQKVEYDNVTRKISITIAQSVGVTNFYFFQIPPSRQNNSTAFTTFTDSNVSGSGMFNDSYEIFGAKPVKYEDIKVGGFKTSTVGHQTSGNSTVYTSYYPASLYTMESINLTTNLQTHSYSTPHLDANSSSSMLIPTSIFARIWFDMAELEDLKNAPRDIISYSDPGTGVFSVDLQNKSINEIRLKLTDSKGRDLDEVSDGQYSNGNLNYTAVFKWEAIMKPQVGQSLGYLNDSRIFKPFQF